MSSLPRCDLLPQPAINSARAGSRTVHELLEVLQAWAVTGDGANPAGQTLSVEVVQHQQDRHLAQDQFAQQG
jgi:hypothetical protein